MTDINWHNKRVLVLLLPEEALFPLLLLFAMLHRPAVLPDNHSPFNLRNLIVCPPQGSLELSVVLKCQHRCPSQTQTLSMVLKHQHRCPSQTQALSVVLKLTTGNGRILLSLTQGLIY